MDFDIHQAANMLVSLKTRAIEHHNSTNHLHHLNPHLHVNLTAANSGSHPQLATHLDELTQSGPYDLRRNQVIEWRTLLPLFTIDAPAHHLHQPMKQQPQPQQHHHHHHHQQQQHQLQHQQQPHLQQHIQQQQQQHNNNQHQPQQLTLFPIEAPAHRIHHPVKQQLPPPLQPTQQPQQTQQQQPQNQPQPQHQQQPQPQQHPQPQQPQPQQQQNQSPQQLTQSQQNHVKRPSNSFILFARKYRPLVHELHPNCDNRNVSKILGDWWYKLDKSEKDKYKSAAFQQKEDHFKKHPEWKWCTKSQSSPSATGGASGGRERARRDSSSAIFSPPAPMSAPPLSAPPLTAPSTFASSSGSTSTSATAQENNNHQRVQQQRFFGPNFPDDLSAAGGSSSSRDYLDLSLSSSSKLDTPLSASFQTPTSPCLTADDTKESTSHRRTLSKQRKLVMELFNSEGFWPSAAATTKFLAEHDNVFKDKKQLQHKIREVRQNFMSQTQSGSLTPGALPTITKPDSAK